MVFQWYVKCVLVILADISEACIFGIWSYEVFCHRLHSAYSLVKFLIEEHIANIASCSVTVVFFDMLRR